METRPMNEEEAKLIFPGLMQLDFNTITDIDDKLKKLGALVDSSDIVNSDEGTKKAIVIGEELVKGDLEASKKALVYYFLGNAWNSLDKKNNAKGNLNTWLWEREEIENEIIYARQAIKIGIDNSDVGNNRKCQFYTNYASALDRIGRFISAIRYWRKALTIDSEFAMAQGNLGIGLFSYAQHLYGDQYKALMFKESYKFLVKALEEKKLKTLEKGAIECFQSYKKKIEGMFKKEFLEKETDWNKHELGKSTEEQQYRKWCLNNNLFINPFNDITELNCAAKDIISTPPIRVKKGLGPRYQGMFNQIKSEFISARYKLYENSTGSKQHFIDNDCFYVDTLDYPEHNFSADELKVAYRMFYSVFDKIAYFLYDYLELSLISKIPTREHKRLYFSTVWRDKEDNKNELKEYFEKKQNWPLRGLYWLSRDLHEKSESDFKVLEPEAEELHKIRNELEHKYLKLHMMPIIDEQPDFANDTLESPFYIEDFRNKTLELARLVREAIIYLSLAVHREELSRAKENPDDGYMPIKSSTL